MPCNETRKVSVVWTEHTDLDRMAEAIVALGGRATVRDGRVYGTLRYRSITYDGQARALRYDAGALSDENELRRAYSRAVVAHTAKRFGWMLQQTGTDTYRVRKRG